MEIKEIKVGSSIVNIYTKSISIVLSYDNSTILLKNENRDTYLIYWSDLLENFRYEH